MIQDELGILVPGNKQGKKERGTFGKKMIRKYIRGDNRRSKGETIITGIELCFCHLAKKLSTSEFWNIFTEQLDLNVGFLAMKCV